MTSLLAELIALNARPGSAVPEIEHDVAMARRELLGAEAGIDFEGLVPQHILGMVLQHL